MKKTLVVILFLSFLSCNFLALPVVAVDCGATTPPSCDGYCPVGYLCRIVSSTGECSCIRSIPCGESQGCSGACAMGFVCQYSFAEEDCICRETCGRLSASNNCKDPEGRTGYCGLSFHCEPRRLYTIGVRIR